MLAFKTNGPGGVFVALEGCWSGGGVFYFKWVDKEWCGLAFLCLKYDYNYEIEVESINVAIK